MRFHHSLMDTPIFIYHHGADTTNLLLHIDDIVLTASSMSLLESIISYLRREFAMTDLGALNYLLGILATRSSHGLFLSLRKYTSEILEPAHMTQCNPARTHVETTRKLDAIIPPISDPSPYCSLAGVLQYLTFTRPDIAYVVQTIFLFMHDPREPHLHMLMRILHYILWYFGSWFATLFLPHIRSSCLL